MSPQMLRTLSCASNQCVAQHAGAICGKVASFWSFELLGFSQKKTFLFIISTVKQNAYSHKNSLLHFYRKGRWCNHWYWEDASWLYLSCSTGAGYVAQRPQCMCSTGQNRTSLCVSINSSVYGGLLVRIAARWESLPFQRLIILAALWSNLLYKHYALCFKQTGKDFAYQEEDDALCCWVFLEGNTGWVLQKKNNLKKSCKSTFYISFLGKVERQMTEAGNNKSSQAVETLLEAIKLSQQHDQKFE